MDSLDIYGIVLCVFNHFILIPIIIYGLVKYNKTKKKQFNIISNRDSFLTNTIHLFCIIGTSLERTLLISIRVWHIIDIKYLWAVYIFYSICWMGALCSFAIKVYLLYFKQQYHMSISHKSWKQNINPNNRDWYIENKNTFGNITYLVKISFIPYILSIIILTLFPIFAGEGLAIDFITLTLAAIPIWIAFIIFWKARTLNDIYCLRNEVFYECLIIFVVLITYLILFLVTHFNEYLQRKYPVNVLRFEWAGYVILTDGVAVGLCIVSTYYPLYIVKQKKEEIMLFEEQSIDMSASAATLHSHSRHTNLQDMNQILRDYKLFQSFMSYLVSEFCAENGLFLCELIQIKHHYQMLNKGIVKTSKSIGNTDEFIIIDFNINPFDTKQIFKTEKETFFTYLCYTDCTIMTKLSLPIEIPKTIILTKYENDLYNQMYALYNKYIKVGSDHELNISYSIRNQLANVFRTCNNLEKHSECDYFNVMDECGIEITGLMQQSFARFATTAIFETIKIDKNITDAKLKKLLNSKETGIIKQSNTICTHHNKNARTET
eukprot:60326_1